MNFFKKITITIFCVGLISSFKTNEENKVALYKQPKADIESRVQDLLKRMTLEEKVAQMRMFHANKGVEFSEDGKLVLSDVVQQKLTLGIGGIKNPGEHNTPEEAAELNNQLQKYIIKNSRLGIPGFFVTESYNGVDAAGCTSFGRPINMASTFNRALIKKVYDAVGREARMRGLHLTHSPEADIVRDPRFGRMSEAFSEDTYLTTQMIINAVNGLQGDYEGLSKTHIGAVTKHFAGYAQLAGGTNFASIEISPRTLIDEIFPPFEAAVKEANTLGIMASHGDLNGIASHANPWLLTEVLRDQWNFEGYVVSDANDIGRLHYFMKVAETPEEAALLGLLAGVDVDLYAEDAYALLPKMVKEKPELMQYIDRSAARVLRTKFILGLFEDPYIKVKKVNDNVRTPENLELARASDRESIILLKNDGVLPLDSNKAMKLALVGPVLDETVKEQFASIVGENITLVTEKGFDLTNGRGGIPELTKENIQKEGIEKIINTAKSADVIVAVVGGDDFTSKEGFFTHAFGDRDSIDPVGLQDELIVELKKLGKPVVIVLKHRRTLSVNTFAKEADAMLDCWDLSEEGNYAIAEVLFGKVNPSGKLPVTVPRSIGQIPFHYSQKEINYKKGYLFAENTPLFDFGFGLSYTQFEYSDISLSSSEMTDDSELTARITITNKGDRAGKETVQLYLKDLIGQVVRPMQELKGFEKIELAAGESKVVSFKITPDMLEYTGLEMKKIPGYGDFELRIGSSSAEFKATNFKLKSGKL
ncbi:glycoside hydrolase family 3 C-terminal domain-containing protein [Flammeovirga yaeyamensis]|uniref:beta-glucosidase n=1 Tax=Flammeovirga yaeyamensis TaxID=367791 RepID=A0AAX1NE74_9BACT|nr:glycoside hydrolase family 3 N-terminal domain-containing protein [Flammeovirga yaeyamensis]MBB3696627.1 beta-glucosidase [Flammeovirga yaeyamensis]NMF33300.1 beta-glucosidase [Flammeovirga yaeyamensis]QWG05421.1 glycoside hydrolase family 3 C-terminal domain-containing protein [Flammeovirga yaeyamensis]